MELRSEPTYETVNVTDLDIQFPNDFQTFTLRDGLDSYTRDGDVLELTFAAANGRMQFHLQHAHWIAIRERTIRVLVPEGQSAKSAVPQLQTPTRTEQ